MAEDKKEPSWDALDKKVVSIDTQLKSHAGKSGQNPFQWAKVNSWENTKKQVALRNKEGAEALSKIPDTISCAVDMYGNLKP